MMLYLRLLLTTATPGEAAEPRRRREAWEAAVRAEGSLVASGELADGDGFFDIVRVADRHAAERLHASDPLVEFGVVAGTLHRLDTFHGEPTPKDPS